MIKKFIHWLTRRDRVLLAHHSLLKTYGGLLTSIADRLECSIEIQAGTMKTVAAMIESGDQRQELLDYVARLESHSDAMRCHIEQFKEAVKAL